MDQNRIKLISKIQAYIKVRKKKQRLKVDKLAKSDLPLGARQKLAEDPKLLELSIDPRSGKIDKQFTDVRRPDPEKGLIL
jgi:hypothetical protein